jgi:GNAT superfamily N-acetyltransferase
MSTPPAVTRVAAPSPEQLQSLAELLVDVVDGDGSVSFLHPLDLDRSLDFWRRIADDVARGDRALLLAEDALGVVGSVHLMLAQPENQPHRADVAKLLVHRRARRRGLGAALIQALDDVARDCGKSVLVLDTETGGEAERLYARLGWQRCGVIPDFALRPRGGLAATTLFSRHVPG